LNETIRERLTYLYSNSNLIIDDVFNNVHLGLQFLIFLLLDTGLHCMAKN